MKFIKWLFIVIISILILGEAAILISGKTFLNRVFALTIFSGKLSPDIDELNLFEYREIATAKPQPWPISVNYNKTKIAIDLMQKMESFKTTSFLVIKNDSIIYENYWEKYNDKSVTNSFSMANTKNGVPMIELAKQKAIELVNGYNRNTQFQIIANDYFVVLANVHLNRVVNFGGVQKKPGQRRDDLGFDGALQGPRAIARFIAGAGQMRD